MITLYTFGLACGLPDLSPFVMKAEMLLKMAGLEYRADTTGFRKSPKGKLPYINDDGMLVADSTFIRLHIERKYGIDFDKGLTPEQRGIAWATEKMLEDHLYFAMVHVRWMDDANFNKGPAQFFDFVPAPVRPVVKHLVRKGLGKTLKGQGIGRHSKEEIDQIAVRAVDALAAILGEKQYLMGASPCGADATVFAFAAGVLAKHFETPVRTSAEKHANLVAYCARMMQQYYPAFGKVA